jgi:hypothetical protein
MSNQVNVPSVTLQTAVLMQVKEFSQNSTQFSVHDITRGIRDKTSAGEMEIPEVEVTGASFRFDIPHTKVKSLFEELWRTGVFDPDFTLNRQFNGMYFQYTPQPLNNLTTGTVTTTSNVVVPSVTQTTPPSVQVVTGTPASQKVVLARVEEYLSNCSARNFRPTLKQVQSAIKRDTSTGWSCDDLRVLIEDDLGYEVAEDPNYISASQVCV